jgi:hypothetical protein
MSFWYTIFMSERLLLESLEEIRALSQIPCNTGVGLVSVRGNHKFIPHDPFAPNLDARKKLDYPPPVDMLRAIDLAEAVNTEFSSNTIAISETLGRPDTGDPYDWVRTHYENAVSEAEKMALRYNRAIISRLIGWEHIDTKHVLSQVVAEYLVNKAIVPASTSRFIRVDPAAHFNPFEFAALRQEFHKGYINDLRFQTALSMVALRKGWARPFLASILCDTVGKPPIMHAISVFKELVVPDLINSGTEQ